MIKLLAIHFTKIARKKETSMKYILFFVIISLGLSANGSQYEELWEEIQQIDKLKAGEAFKLEEFFIMKDEAGIELDGMIYFFNAFDRKKRLALFKGKGKITLTPPDKFEKLALESKFGKETFERDFENATFTFTDDFYEFIKSNTEKYAFVSSDYSSKDDKKMMKRTKDYLIEYKTAQDINTDLALNLLNKEKGYFLMIFQAEDNDYSFKISPNEFEEITLSERVFTGKYLKEQLSPILSFHKREDYLLPATQRMRFTNTKQDLISHDIEVVIDKKLDMKLKSKMLISIPDPNTHWVKFNLFALMEDDSVFVNDQKAVYHKNENDAQSYSFWLNISKAKQDTIKTIEVYYRGNIVRRIQNFMFIKSYTGWYPTFGFFEQAVFRTKYTVPNNYTFIAPGTLISKTQTDSDFTVSYVSDSSEIHTTFSIGPYKNSSIKEEGYPLIDLYYYNASQIEETKLDLLQSYKFYSGLFGDLGMDTVYATEIYSGHGQAFSNFLHLSFANFTASSSEEFGLVSFVAHEMAHQWWGIGGISPGTSRDNWLSEGFAEYSSLMYAQLIFGDNKDFLKHIKKTRKNILTVARRENFALPIIMGGRTYKRKHPKDGMLMTYHKSAWVIHMLRNMMIDFNTMDETAFKNMMKDYFTTFKGKGVITEDFKSILDKHFGTDMAWFIDQWIYGVSIPTYTFGWKSEKQDNGKYLIKCRVKQEHVTKGFKASVPINVDMGENGVATVRTFIAKDFTEFTLPLMPAEPEELIFNAYESVLCEVENEDYEDVQENK